MESSSYLFLGGFEDGKIKHVPRGWKVFAVDNPRPVDPFARSRHWGAVSTSNSHLYDTTYYRLRVFNFHPNLRVWAFVDEKLRSPKEALPFLLRAVPGLERLVAISDGVQ